MGVKDSLVATLANEYAHGQPGLTPGLADLLIIGPGGFVGFMELKSAKGRLSKAQERFRAICDACGVPHRVTRGRDEPIEVLAEWGIVRPSTSSGGR